MSRRHWLALGLLLALPAAPRVGADEPPGHTHPPGTPAHQHPPAPIRITMEELHRHGGVPPGWHFALPPGDPTEGRAVFAKLECFTCHAVKGERFGAVPKSADDVGPELTGMGAHHPPAYFSEAIVNPNAVIVTGPGYTGADGLSRMPDYNDILTVRQLIDLVAYLASLTGDHGTTPMPHGPAPGGHGTSSPGKAIPR
jgi:mono/diheme cytochrome c family protein